MLAIAAEWLCYKCFTTDAHYPRLGDILLANLVSWLVGIVLCAFLPTGLVLTPPHGSEAKDISRPDRILPVTQFFPSSWLAF